MRYINSRFTYLLACLLACLLTYLFTYLLTYFALWLQVRLLNLVFNQISLRSSELCACLQVVNNTPSQLPGLANAGISDGVTSSQLRRQIEAVHVTTDWQSYVIGHNDIGCCSIGTLW